MSHPDPNDEHADLMAAYAARMCICRMLAYMADWLRHHPRPQAIASPPGYDDAAHDFTEEGGE